MRKAAGMRTRGTAGQSIVEYLIVAALVILAVAAVRGPLSGNVNSVYTNASNKVNDAATALGALTIP